MKPVWLFVRKHSRWYDYAMASLVRTACIALVWASVLVRWVWTGDDMHTVAFMFNLAHKVYPFKVTFDVPPPQYRLPVWACVFGMLWWAAWGVRSAWSSRRVPPTATPTATASEPAMTVMPTAVVAREPERFATLAGPSTVHYTKCGLNHGNHCQTYTADTIHLMSPVPQLSREVSRRVADAVRTELGHP